jgi:hypothetical protein
VSATRFRFSHTPVRYQDDFINDLILTRRATDKFSDDLIPLKKTTQNVETKLHSFKDKVLNLFGLKPLTLEASETEAPNAFTYSLFYVFYD